MIDVWQFIFVGGSVHPQPMARSQTGEKFNRFSIDWTGLDWTGLHWIGLDWTSSTTGIKGSFCSDQCDI